MFFFFFYRAIPHALWNGIEKLSVVFEAKLVWKIAHRNYLYLIWCYRAYRAIFFYDFLGVVVYTYVDFRSTKIKLSRFIVFLPSNVIEINATEIILFDTRDDHRLWTFHFSNRIALKCFWLLSIVVSRAQKFLDKNQYICQYAQNSIRTIRVYVPARDFNAENQQNGQLFSLSTAPHIFFFCSVYGSNKIRDCTIWYI